MARDSSDCASATLPEARSGAPDDVVARRYFERVGGGPGVAAPASPVQALAPVPIVCGAAAGFVAGRLTARGRGRLAPARN